MNIHVARVEKYFEIYSYSNKLTSCNLLKEIALQNPLRYKSTQNVHNNIYCRLMKRCKMKERRRKFSNKKKFFSHRLKLEPVIPSPCHDATDRGGPQKTEFHNVLTSTNIQYFLNSFTRTHTAIGLQFPIQRLLKIPPHLKCVAALPCRDVKSSRPKWPRGQNFGLGLGLGLEALASASALASNIWPRPGLGLQQKNQQPR